MSKSYSRVGEIAIIDGERVEAKEQFRAGGVTWVRYQRLDGENRYAFQEEWDGWVK